MPKLYEYLGLSILFYSNEHEPIHVHGKYQGRESKAIIVFLNGKFKEIILMNVKGKAPLRKKELKNLLQIVEKNRDDIVRKWVDFFVYNKEIKPERLTKK